MIAMRPTITTIPVLMTIRSVVATTGPDGRHLAEHGQGGAARRAIARVRQGNVRTSVGEPLPAVRTVAGSRHSREGSGHRTCNRADRQ